jgi:hypothetical protein
MNDVSNNIYTQYVDHLPELPLDKQIHFASRLYLWSGDGTCRTILDDLQTLIWRGRTPETLVRDLHAGKIFVMNSGAKLIASQMRASYLERYPELRAAAFTLYWAQLLDTLYGQNLRASVLKTLPVAVYADMYDQLLHDPAAMRALSTYAVNFMYIYRQYVQQEGTTELAQYLQDKVATTPGTSSPEQEQLFAYLITHCIINATGFYAHPVPANEQAVYRSLLETLEMHLDQSYEALRLDNKLEFLVCCRLVGYESNYEKRILEEAASCHAKPYGIIAQAPGSTDTALARAEHRNVLYLMATSASGRLIQGA